MAIIACDIPSFPLALLARSRPQALEHPLALLDAGERVVAVTGPARLAGVRPGHSARQAQIICPDLILRPADLPAARQEFEAVLSLLDDYADVVEEASLGRAYLDAPDLDQDAVLFCQDLGRSLRSQFSAVLQPAIGCDRSKFTAAAAATHTRPGRVRVVQGAAERPFLQPLPVTLLPLPASDLQLLRHLGIRTLGQYAALPEHAVFQQFGPAGRLARQWALGRDNRPVISRRKPLSFTQRVDFDPPLTTLPPLLTQAERLLTGLLSPLQNTLQAAQTLIAIRHLAGGPDVTDQWRLSAPTHRAEDFLQLLAGRWGAVAWDAPVASLSLTLAQVREAPGEQLLLFPGEGAPRDLLQEVVMRLGRRYDPTLFMRAEVQDGTLLRVEQRAMWRPFAA